MKPLNSVIIVQVIILQAQWVAWSPINHKVGGLSPNSTGHMLQSVETSH